MKQKGREGTTSVRISSALAKRAHVAAVLTDRRLRDVVDEALADWLRKNDKAQRPA